MLQRFVDNLLAIAKESVKTFTYESLNNIVRLINGISALLLAILPGKAPILEGMHGWELRPTFRGPRLPRWMENGVSSFNQFLHDLSDDSDCSSTVDSLSEDDDLDTPPGSPLSETSRSSRLSRASSFSGYDRTLFHVLKRLFSWILWVLTFILCLPLLLNRSFGFGKSGTAQSGFVGKQEVSNFHTKKPYPVKDLVIHRTTDRRRGVVEDLQLGIEMFIEAVFDSFHKAAHFVLSPSEAYQTCCRWLSSHGNTHEDISNGEPAVPVATATLGEDDPTPTVRQTTSHQWLNTDARTCEDVIRGHGYPYEAIRVVTDDGYVLLLERIPRRDSQKVVYLQHGILDSSLGWVSNGVVGSPAFAAFDRGYDVFLGNLRGLVSREHIDKNISSRRYWNYSINEHGIQDMPAIIQKIHETKISELKTRYPSECEDSKTDQPYRLCGICHSLGGAAMLMYVTTCCIDRKPHRMSRLILLSPAGFHEDSTMAFTVAEHIMLSCGPILAPFIPGLYIPTRFFRMILNKLVRDFHNYPALGGLVQTLMSYVVGGDSSNWVGVLGLTHYNMYDMPGMSLHVAIHLAQLKRAKKFIMYDYGSAAANMEAYGSPEPLDIGQHYNLIDIPVDFVAGRKDQVIRPSMVKKHYRVMRKAGVETSFNEFEYAHLDFTFSHREELLSYVMSRLTLVVPPQEDKSNHCNVKERKTRKNQVRYSRDHSESEIKRLDDSDTCGSP